MASPVARPPLVVMVDGISFKEFSRGAKLRFYRILLLVVCGAAAAAAALFIVLGADGPGPGPLPLILALLAAAAVIAAVIRFEYSCRKEYERLKLSGLSLRYTFSSEGWRVESRLGSSEHSWSSVDRISEDELTVTFCPNTKAANVIPKRCISYMQIDRIRALFENSREKPRKSKKRLKKSSKSAKSP